MAVDSQMLPFKRYNDGQWSAAESPVIREWPLNVKVNGKEFVTLLCTPTRLNALVIGFLFHERVIDSLDQIAFMRICPDETECEVRIEQPRMDAELRRMITSGCGGGTSFGLHLDLPRVDSNVQLAPVQITAMVKLLLETAVAYKDSGGVHSSALGDGSRLLAFAEDVGRHNTIDKVAGECLLAGIATKDHLLVTTGRISSDMLLKAGRMGVPIVVSRTSPTDLAVRIARDLNITVVGYVRGRTMNVYCGEQRIAAGNDN